MINLISFRYNDENNTIEIIDKQTELILNIYKLPTDLQSLNTFYYNDCVNYHNVEILVGIKGVPHWKHTYLYKENIYRNYGACNNIIPKTCRKFYKVFKSEFLNENFLDLNGETNYSFYLMFDLLKSKQNNLQKHLLNLIKHYPEVTYYCESEMGELGLECREYQNKKYLKAGNNIYVVADDFQNKQLIIEWLNSDFFKHTGVSVYINDDSIINVVEDKTITLYGNEKHGCKVFPHQGILPQYIKFGEVDGYFKIINNIWSSEKNRNNNYQGGEMTIDKVISLEGSPSIVNGDFICEKIGLDSLEGGPKIVRGNYNCRGNNISSFVGAPTKIEKDFNFSNNNLTDESWEYCRDNIEGEWNGQYNLSGNKFIKYRKELY